MSERVEVITAADLKQLIEDLCEIKSLAETLRENNQPIFKVKHYLTDSNLCRKLKVCNRTLAAYRANGALGYYNLPGKILYSDTDVEAFLQRHYLPPFR